VSVEIQKQQKPLSGVIHITANSPYPSPVWSQEYAGMYGTEMLETT
jgi:hypothetical protein